MDHQGRPPGRPAQAIDKQVADIRRTLESTPAPGESERRHLDETAFALMDPSLQALLEAHHLTVAVPALLVIRNIFNLDDLAKKLHTTSSYDNLFTGPQALPQCCRDDLVYQTETRGKLLAVPLTFTTNNDWLDGLCKDHPTLASLYQKRFAELDAYLTSSGACEADRRGVISVWIAAEKSVNVTYDVRQLVEASALPLTLIDTLESIPLRVMANLTELTYKRAVSTLSTDPDKSKLRRLFQEWSTSERQRRNADSAQVKQAMGDMKALKTALERNTVTPDQLRAQLGNINELLASNSFAVPNARAQFWTISEADAANPQEAAKILDKYLVELQSVAAKLERPIVEDDAHIIASISAGQALRGIPFGMAPSSVFFPASRTLLQVPENCTLLNASLPFESTSEEFSSSQACNRYNETLSSSGRSFAASLKASGWSFVVDATGKSTSASTELVSRERTESTTASKSVYLFVPVRAFSIGVHQMKLTEEAKNDARHVGNLHDARMFLQHYYSHIPSGVQHVGGIFVQTVTVSTNDASSLKSELKCFGPSVSHPDLFVKALNSDTGTWHLIDRGGYGSLVPVWKILERDIDGTVRSKAPLLRRAWLVMARAWKTLDDPSINSYISNVEMEECSFLNGLPFGGSIFTSSDEEQWQTDEDIDEAVTQIDGAISTRVGASINISQMTSISLAQIVLDVNRIIARFSAHSHRDLIPAIVARGSLQNLLNAIADSSEKEKTRFAIQLIRLLIPPESRTRLLQRSDTSAFFSQPAILQLFQDDATSSATETNTQIFEPVILDQLAKLEEEVNTLINEAESSECGVDEKSRRLGVFLSLNLHYEVSVKDKALQDFLRAMLASKFELLRGGFYHRLNDEQISLVCQYISKAVQCYKTIGETTGEEPYQLAITKLQAEFATAYDVANQASQAAPPVMTHDLPSGLKNYAALLLDRPHSTTLRPVNELLIDVLRHRLSLDLIKEKLSDGLKLSSTEELDASQLSIEQILAMTDQVVNPPPANSKTVTQSYQALLSLLNSSDISAKEYLLRLLLERRYAVPFAYPDPDSTSFKTTATALSFIRTSVSSKQLISLCNDATLLRIAVLSYRSTRQSNTTSFIKNIFSCSSAHMLSELTESNESLFPPVIVEVGFGFIPNGSEQPKVVILFHVIGDYRRVLPWLQKNKLVHMYIVEDQPKELATSSRNCGFVDNALSEPFENLSLLLYCPSTNAYEKPNIKSTKHGVMYTELSGMLGTSESKICKDFHTMILKYSSLLCEGATLPELGPAVFSDNGLQIDKDDIQLHTTVQRIQREVEDVMNSTNIAELRSQQLRLQHSFQRESEAEFKAAEDAVRTGHSAAVQTAAAQKCTEEQRTRAELAALIERRVPLIQLSLKLAAAQSSVERYVFFRSLENLLATHSRPVLTDLKQKYKRAEAARLHKPDDEFLIRQERQAKQLFADTTCHIEHIWRELSHLFVANNLGRSPPCYSYLPQVAAQHLLDGFPLELMDGDAGKMNDLWVKLVLKQLRAMLNSRDGREPRVFVLSIVGVQSCGKSTLLNILFGCRFRVSTGMCTRGVNMMLIKVEDRVEYDYIVLLDTEGVRSEALVDTTTRDNRLAAFAIWPADATIVMIAGEDSEALKKILPVIGDAYQSSPLAEQYGYQLASKLFFAQRGLTASANDSVGAQEGLKSNLQSTLHDSLRSASIDLQKHRQRRVLQQEGKSMEEERDVLDYDYTNVLAALKQLVNTFSAELTDDILLGALIVSKRGHPEPNPQLALRILNLSAIEEGTTKQYSHSDLKLQAARYRTFQYSTIQSSEEVKGSIFDMIKDCNFDTDHIILGMNLEGSHPPKDVPNPNYGHQLLQFRETIHQRVVRSVGWRARTLGEWTDYLQEVWPAIMSANLALSRESIEQRRIHETIDEVASRQRSIVANAYASAFDKFDKDLTANKEKWLENVTKKVEAGAKAQHRQATPREKETAFIADLQRQVCNGVLDVITSCQAAINKLVDDYPMYQEFAVITRERWNQFLETQKQRSDQRVADHVSNRVFYLSIVDQYKSQVITKVDELLSTQTPAITQAWSDKERKAKFKLIFKPIWKDATMKFPSMYDNVERRIRDVFASVHFISGDQMPDVSGVFPTSNSPEPKLTFWRQIWNVISGKNAQQKRQRKQDKATLRDIFTKVEELLGPTTPYSDPLVHKAIDIILLHLTRDKRDSFHRQVRQAVYLLLVNRLTKSQEAWEVENSVPQRLKRDKPLLFETFKGRCDNLTTAQLFQGAIEVLVRRDSSTLLTIFKAEVKRYVIRELISEAGGERKYKWAGRPDGDALQALVDLDLLDTITKNDDSKLMTDLLNPGPHYDRLVKQKLTEVTKKMLQNPSIWDHLRTKIVLALESAAVIATNASEKPGIDPRRVAAFLNQLREAELPADLIDRLPNEVDYNTKLDKAPDVFTTIARNIINAIPPRGLIGMPITIQSDTHIQKIVGLVWMEMTTYRAGKALQARCDSGCRMCGLACTRERGHLGNHTTNHQPNGLNGWRDKQTNILWKYSCVEDHHNHTGFTINGVDYNWNDWTTVFTGWDAPAGMTVRLKVREYIFYHKQSMLVRQFPNTIKHPPPPEFNHLLEDLRRELKITAGL